MTRDPRRCALILAALLPLSCRSAPSERPRQISSPHAPASEGFRSDRTATTRDGRLVVAWKPVPDPIPVDEMFELVVLVTEAGPEALPVEGAIVWVRGSMPNHGHGMNVEPRSTELGDGLYRVRGMLLHMAGRWELGIDVVHDSIAASADFELFLE